MNGFHKEMRYPEESFKIIGAAMKVHAALGPDFICYDKIIVELKAVKELDDVHRSQAINYAKVAGYKLSLLINFGQPSLQKERYPVG